MNQKRTSIQRAIERLCGSLKGSDMLKALLEERARDRMETYATVKGQIVIPSSVRRKFGIKEGTRIQIDVDEENHRIVLTPITREYIRSLRGKYKGLGLMKTLMEDRKREREL